jgi:hypothetical protein
VCRAGVSRPRNPIRHLMSFAKSISERFPAASHQFFWTMQLPPAAFRFEHNSVACSAETNGPTMVR